MDISGGDTDGVPRGPRVVAVVVHALVIAAAGIARDAADGCAPGETPCEGKLRALRLCVGGACGFAASALVAALGAPPARTTLGAAAYAVPAVALTAAFAAVPGSAADTLNGVAATLGAAFLLLQTLVMIEWIYKVNDGLVGAAGDGKAGASAAVVGLAAVSLGGAVALLVFGFVAFADSCAQNRAILSVATALTAVLVLCSLIERAQGGLLSASLASCYVSFSAVAALFSTPRGDSCTPDRFENAAGVNSGLQTATFFIAVAFAAYASIHLGTTGLSALGIDRSARAEHALLYAVLALGTAHAGAQLVGWTVDSDAAVNHSWQYDIGWYSVAAKLSSGGLFAAMFLFACVAPILFPSRSF